MRHFFQLLTYFFALFFFFSTYSCSSSVSCGSNKDAFVNNFYAFVQDIREQQQNSDISENKWEIYDLQFNKLTKECYQQHEANLNASDQFGIATSVCFYFYSKHGLLTAMTKLVATDIAIKKVLLELNYNILFKAAQEIVSNPEEIHKIMSDLEKRYGK